MDVTEHVRRARAAYSTGQWSTARTELRRAHRDGHLEADDLGLLATCEWWLGQIPAAVAVAEEAFQARMAAGQVDEAARGALDLALIGYTAGEPGLASAWFGQARRALAGREGEPAYGYLVYADAVSRLELDGELRGDAESVIRAASLLASLPGGASDPTLSTFVTVLRGLSAVLRGTVEAGFELLEEAMLSVLAGQLPPLWAGDVYCTVLHLCESLGDLARMRRWARAMEAWATPLSRSFTYYGVAKVHRLQLSSAEGDWDLVEQELGERSRLLAPAHGWVAGEGFRELGDVRRLRGDARGAAEAYAAAQQLGIDPQPGRALLTAAGGHPDTALDQIHESLATRRPFEGSRLLLAGVRIALDAGATGDARQFTEQLAQIAAHYDSPGLTARSAHARGLVELTEGHAAAALSALEQALEVYREQRYRYGVAAMHELLARARHATGEEQAARADHATALAVYRSLGAAPDVARLSPTERAPGGLTAREVEVLAAIAAGASNRQVGRDLVISEKTVGRHLANIYRKLDVTSRTAAAAWAHRHGIGAAP